MIPLEQVQGKVRDLIAADTYFNGETVIVADGFQDPTIQAAMASRGFAIAVSPVLRAVRKSQGANKVELEGETMVMVCVNPKINPQVANKDINTAVSKVLSRVLGYRPVNPNDLFGVAEESLQLATYDAGRFEVDLFFTKKIVFG